MSRRIRFVIAGFGNVGRQIASSVSQDTGGDLQIAAIAARDRAAARERMREIGLDVPVIAAADASRYAPVVVEAATHESFREIVEPALRAACHVVVVSAGALATRMDLIETAERTGGSLRIASGTLPGLDIIRSAREAGIEQVRLVSSVLPRSLANEPFILANGIDLAAADRGPIPVFKGTARQAAENFPRHFNVAVSLSLAGIGLDRTMVEIAADGSLPGVRHRVYVKSAVITLEMTSSNLPSAGNSRTSRIVAPSIIAALRSLSSPVTSGS